MLAIMVGFAIALGVGLTSVGGGSLTTPLLVLVLGLPPALAVGTALAFSAELRLLAAPMHLFGRNVRGHCFWPLVAGGLPGLGLGIALLRHFDHLRWSPAVLVALGIVLMITGGGSLWAARAPSLKPPLAGVRRRWLALLALPIGVETGFSSAGSGAIGVVALLHLTDLTAAEAVGTNLLFGAVLSLAGGAWSAAWGLLRGEVLLQLLLGGVPGVLLGQWLSRRLHARHLRTIALTTVLLLGLALVWTGMGGAGR